MYEAVIGLEVHVQLSTDSKIFSGSSTNFGAEPNTQASLIDLGMPGVLPVPNAKAFEMAVKFGLAIDAEIGQGNQSSIGKTTSIQIFQKGTKSVNLTNRSSVPVASRSV